MKSLSIAFLLCFFCSLFFSFAPENEETPFKDECSCLTGTADSSSNVTLGTYILDIEFDDTVCLGDEGIIKFNYPGIYLNQDSFPGCTNGSLGIDSFTNTITVYDNGVYQLSPVIFYSTSAPPDSIDIASYLILQDDSFYANVCSGTIGQLEITYTWQSHSSGASTSLCEITDTMVFTCPSSYDLNATIYISQTNACSPATLFTSHSGNNTTQFTWSNVNLPFNSLGYQPSIVVQDPTLTNVQVIMVDSNFTTCEIGYDTLNTNVNYQGFEAIISSSGNTTYDCTDPTVYLLLSDLYLVDSLNYSNHSFQWRKNINGVPTNITGENYAKLKKVNVDGSYSLVVTMIASPNCQSLSNSIVVSGLRSEMYALGIDGGNIICLGDSSPELKFTPPLPYPFPNDANMDVYFNGVSQNDDLSIYNEGNYYVEIDYAGGCRTFSDTLIANLDTTICDTGFAVSPNNFICINDPVAFIYRGTNDDSNTYEWTFAGGSPSTYEGYYPPLINFSSSGTFTIDLEITGPFGSYNFEREITVHEECCEHEYEATVNSDFSSILGKGDKITQFSGGGVFEGVFNVIGTIVLTEGVYTISDGSTFFVNSDCEDCDYLATINANCNEFSFNYTQIIVGDGATLNMGDAEFRATCDQMWYGIGVVEGGSINTLNDVSGNNAMVMDALAGITVCDLEHETNETYQLDQVTFTNNIIGLNDLDFAYPHHYNYLKSGHIDNNSSLMKSPYKDRFGMAGINLVSINLKSDFNKNYISNVNYGYYHWLIGDPNTEYHIKNNTIRDFYVAGVAIGGGIEISELIDSKFIFPKIHLGSASTPIPSYADYDGYIQEYDGGVFYYAYSLGSFDKNHIVGALVSGKMHFYGNKFAGYDSVASPNYQVGAVIGRTFGIAPNDVSIMENKFTNLGRGVDHLIGSAEIKQSSFYNNKKAYTIYDDDFAFTDLSILENTFQENEVAIEVLDYDYELRIKENLFLDNDTSISVKHLGSAALDLNMECNSFKLDNTETYNRYGLFVHNAAWMQDIGGDDPNSPNPPSGNGWPVDPSSAGYSSNPPTTTGNPSAIDITLWDSPSNWYSIYDYAGPFSAAWTYWAYDNEFVGGHDGAVFPTSKESHPNNSPQINIADSDCPAFLEIIFPQQRIASMGYEGINNAESMRIFPNPSRNKVFLNGMSSNDIEGVQLIDLKGHKSEIEFSSLQNRIEIDISEFEPGIYILLLVSKQGESERIRLLIK